MESISINTMAKSQIDAVLEKEMKRHEMIVAEEEKRHKAAMEKERRKHNTAIATISKNAKVTVNDNKRKMGVHEESESGGGNNTKQKLEATENTGTFEYKCNGCSDKEKSADDIPNSWRFCELCNELVCQSCANKCEKCTKAYCECVYDSEDIVFCEDCQESKLICCHADVKHTPCGQKVCHDCLDEYHGSYDCSDCMDARRGGGTCDPDGHYWD